VYGTGPYVIVNGSFMADNINMGGAVLNNVTFGMVETGHDWGFSFGGILGLSWDFIETDRVRVGFKYPNMVDLLYNEGYISSHTYSVHMDDISETIVLSLWNAF
jgi:long-subunit fatty acid transport protein